MNGQYLMMMPAVEIYPHLLPFIPEAPLETLRPIIELNKTRARTLRELAELIAPYTADDDSLEYEADAVKKHLKGEDLAARLTELHETLAKTEPFDVTTSEAALRALAEARGLGAGKLIHPLRLALTGRGSSPPVFDVAVVLGKERALKRLQRLIDRLASLGS
jgi:glutamyl/glutaminyl-tRNA synthetase